jgi:RNA polymerase sigma-70 factor (ECF subfamily)
MPVSLEDVAAALSPRLLAYALARTGSRAVAEDVAQDALVALVRRWRQLGPPESPEAFVFAIARRRAGRALARGALMAPLSVLQGMTRDEPTVERTYERSAELASVRAALRKLPRTDREVLLLRATAELSFEEITKVVGGSPAAAKMRLSRARRRLAALLQERTDASGRRTA